MNAMRSNYVLGVIAFLLLGIISAPHAFATNIALTVPGSSNSTSSIGGFVNNFYQFALVIGSLLAFAVVVYGGVRYMTSAGNPSQQSDAKEWIESALLGLLLLAGAYFILYTIDPNLVQLGLPPLSQVQLNNSKTQ